MPLKLFVDNDAMGVALSNGTEDGFAVKVRRARTGSCLEMMGDAACSGVLGLAEGTGNVVTAVGL